MNIDHIRNWVYGRIGAYDDLRKQYESRGHSGLAARATGQMDAFSEMLFHIDSVRNNPCLYCEHGILDGDYCEPCNLEYKRAAKAAGME